MTDKAAFSGSYSDFKLIKSRSVAQVIVEIPVEAAESFLKVFGVPLPGAERPVALALLSTDKPAAPAQQRESPEKGKRRFDELPRSQQAALMCDDISFRAWLFASDRDQAAEAIRRTCLVKSRSEFDGDLAAAGRWDNLLFMFRKKTGRIAEQRG